MTSNGTPPPMPGFPPSMGPGGRPMTPQENITSTARQIQEMRSHYRIHVEPTTLNVGYSLNGEDREFRIPFDSISLGGTSKWLLYGGSGRAFVAGTFYLDILRGAENMIGRRLTQQEAEGFAFHTAKRTQYSFLGTIVGLGGGYAMAAYGYQKMKFPFRAVKPIEAYDVFPSKRLPLISGMYARSAWQITRANVYAALGLILVSPFFRSMGDSIMGVGLYRDPRTAEVVKSMKQGFDRIRINRTQPGQPQGTTPTPAKTEQSMEDANAQDFYREDTASKSQSYFGKSTDYSGDSTFSDSTTDTGSLSDSAMRAREASQSSPSSFGTGRYNQRPDTKQRSSSSDFFFDDASPTAGNDPDPGPSYNQSSRSGSSWDRYRRGGAPPQSQPQPSSQSSRFPSPSDQATSSRGWSSRSNTQGQQQDFETKGDSFSFSNSDEQRALAKEQAQREFDNMLERERKESGSGAYEGGSQAAQEGMEDPRSNNAGSAWDRRRRG